MQKFESYQELMEKSIWNLNITRSRASRLYEEGIITIGQLSKLTINEISQFDYMGRKRAQLIITAMEELGFVYESEDKCPVYKGEVCDMVERTKSEENIRLVHALFNNGKGASYNALLMTPINEFAISEEVISYLHMNKIFTIEDLANVSPIRLREMQGIDGLTAELLLTILKQLGFVYVNENLAPQYKGTLKYVAGSPKIEEGGVEEVLSPSQSFVGKIIRSYGIKAVDNAYVEEWFFNQYSARIQEIQDSGVSRMQMIKCLIKLRGDLRGDMNIAYYKNAKMLKEKIHVLIDTAIKDIQLSTSYDEILVSKYSKSSPAFKAFYTEYKSYIENVMSNKLIGRELKVKKLVSLRRFLRYNAGLSSSVEQAKLLRKRINILIDEAIEKLNQDLHASQTI